MKGRKIATQMGKGEEDRRINKCRPSYFLRHAPLTHLLRRRRPLIGRCGVWLIFIGGLNSTEERYPPPIVYYGALEGRRTFYRNARRNMIISSTLSDSQSIVSKNQKDTSPGSLALYVTPGKRPPPLFEIYQLAACNYSQLFLSTANSFWRHAMYTLLAQD